MSALEPIQLERLREIGALLQREREAKGMSLEDVSAKTLIRPAILRAIEEADARPLPEPVYLRGFIRRYGDLMDLPGVQLSDSFPWEPSKVVPAAFVASGVTTADSVDDNRRPANLPRSEARVVEPDPVPAAPEITNSEKPDPVVSDSISQSIEPEIATSSPVESLSAAAYADPISQNPTEPEAAELGSRASEPEASDSPEAKQAESEQTAATEKMSVASEASEFVNPYAVVAGVDELGTAEPVEAIDESASQVPTSQPLESEQLETTPIEDPLEEAPADPLATATTATEVTSAESTGVESVPAESTTAESVVEDPWQSETTASTPNGSPPSPESAQSSPANLAPLPVPKRPDLQELGPAEQTGLPGGVIAAILAAIALGIGLIFAFGNQGSKQLADSPAPAATEQVEPTPTSPNPATSNAGATAAEEASGSEPPTSVTNPPEGNPSEEAQADKTQTSETATATSEPTSSTASAEANADEVSIALQVKEPAWFYVQVDGFVVFEGITGEFNDTLAGKEVVIGTSRPDLILVSVDGGPPKPMGAEAGDKTETFTAGG